jgi:hypothetical protein
MTVELSCSDGGTSVECDEVGAVEEKIGLIGGLKEVGDEELPGFNVELVKGGRCVVGVGVDCGHQVVGMCECSVVVGLGGFGPPCNG